jgi:hypothetical protein
MDWYVISLECIELTLGQDSVDEGLTLLQENKVSGKKLVYRIADTPSLKK